MENSVFFNEINPTLRLYCSSITSTKNVVIWLFKFRDELMKSLSPGRFDENLKNKIPFIIFASAILHIVSEIVPVTYSKHWYRSCFVAIGQQSMIRTSVNTMRPRQYDKLFADDIIKGIFINENFHFSIQIRLKYVPMGPFTNRSTLVQIMVWCRSGDKSLSLLRWHSSTTHKCVLQSQRVNGDYVTIWFHTWVPWTAKLKNPWNWNTDLTNMENQHQNLPEYKYLSDTKLVNKIQ